jgi:hypothetical protein
MLTDRRGALTRHRVRTVHRLPALLAEPISRPAKAAITVLQKRLVAAMRCLK